MKKDKTHIRNKTIQDLLRDADREGITRRNGRESLKWLAQKSRVIKLSPSSFYETQSQDRMRNTTQIGIGRMYVYNYDPKHKDKLPYYDRMPCIFLVNIYKDSFLGINLHYLPYKYRLILMNELYNLENNAKLSKNKKLEITWNKLKAFSKFSLVKPCVKKYLFNHLRSKLVQIPYEEWNIVATLPISQFEKKSASEVYKDSLSIIRGKK